VFQGAISVPSKQGFTLNKEFQEHTLIQNKILGRTAESETVSMKFIFVKCNSLEALIQNQSLLQWKTSLKLKFFSLVAKLNPPLELSNFESFPSGTSGFNV
jgi:hypothetical protein